MPFLELVLLAFDTIRANKVRAFLTTLGVMIGVLSVILLVSLGEGAKQFLTDSFASIGSNWLQVLPGKKETEGMNGFPAATTHKLTREDELAISRRAFSLDGITGQVAAGGTVRYLNRRRDTFVFGVGSRFLDIHNLRIDTGRGITEEDVEGHRRSCVLGKTVLVELFGIENPLGKTLRVADAEFHVIGVMEHKGTSLGFDLDDLVLIPETSGLDLFAVEGYTKLEARARDKVDTESAMAEITEILKARHGGQVDFDVISQEDVLSTVNKIMNMMTMVLLAIASIGLVVGGIGIANIMLVSVRERTREIGVRRAVGATRRDILYQFLVEAVVISMLGGLVGLGLGAVIIYVTRTLVPELPVQLSGWIVAVAVGFSAAVGVLAGVEPARRASQLDPVEALRWE